MLLENYESKQKRCRGWPIFKKRQRRHAIAAVIASHVPDESAPVLKSVGD